MDLQSASRDRQQADFDKPVDTGEHLAKWYANHFNLMEKSGVDIPENELESVGEELGKTDWVVHRGEDGKWFVVHAETWHNAKGPQRYSRYNPSQPRAPKGGLSAANGRFYRGGCWIPADTVASATPEQQEVIRRSGEAAVGKRQARGSVSPQALREAVQSHSDQPLSSQDTVSARRTYEALKRHHGPLTLHRIEEHVQALQKALDNTKDQHTGVAATRQSIGQKMAAYGKMLDWAAKDGLTGEVKPSEQAIGEAAQKTVRTDVPAIPQAVAAQETKPSLAATAAPLMQQPEPPSSSVPDMQRGIAEPPIPVNGVEDLHKAWEQPKVEPMPSAKQEAKRDASADLKSLYEASSHPDLTEDGLRKAVAGTGKTMTAAQAIAAANAIGYRGAKSKTQALKQIEDAIIQRKGAAQRANMLNADPKKAAERQRSNAESNQYVMNNLPRAKELIAQHGGKASKVEAMPSAKQETKASKKLLNKFMPLIGEVVDGKKTPSDLRETISILTDKEAKSLAAHIGANVNAGQDPRDAIVSHASPSPPIAEKPIVAKPVPHATTPEKLHDNWSNRPSQTSQKLDVPTVAKEVESIASSLVSGQRTSPSQRGPRFGGNKVFISYVYDEFKKSHPEVTRDQFNRYLVEANHNGLLSLSRADLVQAMHVDDVRESNIAIDRNFRIIPHGKRNPLEPVGAEFDFVTLSPTEPMLEERTSDLPRATQFMPSAKQETKPPAGPGVLGQELEDIRRAVAHPDITNEHIDGLMQTLGTHSAARLKELAKAIGIKETFRTKEDALRSIKGTLVTEKRFAAAKGERQKEAAENQPYVMASLDRAKQAIAKHTPFKDMPKTTAPIVSLPKPAQPTHSVEGLHQAWENKPAEPPKAESPPSAPATPPAPTPAAPPTPYEESQQRQAKWQQETHTPQEQMFYDALRRNPHSAQNSDDLSIVSQAYKDHATISDAMRHMPEEQARKVWDAAYGGKQPFPAAEKADAEAIKKLHDSWQSKPSEKQQPLQGTLPDGKKVDFVRHPAGMNRESLVMVDPRKLDAGWKKDSGNYLPTEGKGSSEIVGRREGFADFLKKGVPIQAPRVTVDKSGMVTFDDGRHRFAVLRDMGISKVAVQVPKIMAGEFAKQFGEQPVQNNPSNARAKMMGNWQAKVNQAKVATQQKTTEPSKMAVKTDQVSTRHGLRYVHHFQPNKGTWAVWNSPERPSYLSVYKTKNGVWVAQVYGATAEEVNANANDLVKRGGYGQFKKQGRPYLAA